MNLRHFGRAQQMWVLIVACFMLFALFLLLVPGMGHDVPAELRETFADAIARTAARTR